MTTRPRILKAEYRHTKNGPAKITSDNKRKAGEAVTALLAAAVIVILLMAGMSWKAEAEENAASLKTAQATITALRATDAKRKSEIDGLKQAAIDAEYELDAVNEDLAEKVEQLRQAKREAAEYKARIPKVTTQTRRPAVSKLSAGGWRTAKASWYGSKFYGHTTANGTSYNAKAWGVAATRDIPMGTMVEISYGGKTVKAPVFDRGGFGELGRKFDLSYAVAQSLGFSGVQTIKYRVVGR